MAVAQSIFTLDGWVQLFWAAFDMPKTGVPWKVALRYKKNPRKGEKFRKFKQMAVAQSILYNLTILYI